MTNKIYVANHGSGDVTVINGATNSTQTVNNVSAGVISYAVAVNPVTDKIYVANYGSSNVTVIDGATNSTQTVSTREPQAVAVNPVTDKIYAGGGAVTVIGQSITSVNPLTAIAPLPGNVSSSHHPTFTFSASTTSPLPVEQVWYQVDTTSGTWQRATLLNQAGSRATATLSTQNGTHILFAMATDGLEATYNNASSSTGQISAYAFTVQATDINLQGSPPPTVTKVSPASGPGTGGTSVTITGTHLSGATGVQFGSTDAASFSLSNSDTLITAISPSGSGIVDITVTTPGGTSTTSSADKFTYIPVPVYTPVYPPPTTLPLSINANGTHFNTVISISGKTMADITVNSPDNNATLNIPSGTTLLTSSGTAPAYPTSIIVLPDTFAPQPPPGNTIIGITYSCLPGGLHFNPAVKLTWKLGNLPAGVSPSDLEVAFYDTTSRTWVDVPSTYDPATGSVVATISHFTDYAVINTAVTTPTTTVTTTAPTTTASVPVTTSASSTPITTSTSPPTTTSMTAPPGISTMLTTLAPATISSSGLIIGIIAAVVVILIVLVVVTRKRHE